MPMIDYREFIISSFKTPLIHECANGRSARMRFYNAMNSERNDLLKMNFKDFITILARKYRVIIGPKNFDAGLPIMFDIEFCSQEELTKAFEASDYPKENCFDWEETEKRFRNSSGGIGSAIIPLDIKEKLEAQGMEAMKSLGFGVKREPIEIKDDPYASYAEETEKEKQPRGD